MSATADSFLDTIFARLIALALAIALGVFMYLTWEDDVRALFSDRQDPMDEILRQEGGTPAAEATPELDACLTQRVGDVDRMKSEGVITDAQYDEFRERAITLCNAQNPQ